MARVNVWERLQLTRMMHESYRHVRAIGSVLGLLTGLGLSYELTRLVGRIVPTAF